MEKIEYEIMYKIETGYWWYRGLHDLILQQIEKYRKTSKSDIRLLDAGCGTGRTMELLSEYGSVEGFDFSPYAIDFCKERSLNNVRIQDITTWEPIANSFDFIINLDVLCHKSIPDETEILARFFSALKPGGTLLLNLPAFNLLMRHHDIAVHTKKRFTKSQTINALKKCGFSIKYATYRLPHIFLLMLTQKGIDVIKGNNDIQSDLKPLPKLLNSSLYLINRIENEFIKRNYSFPFGGSLFIAATKNVSTEIKSGN